MVFQAFYVTYFSEHQSKTGSGFVIFSVMIYVCFSALLVMFCLIFFCQIVFEELEIKFPFPCIVVRQTVLKITFLYCLCEKVYFTKISSASNDLLLVAKR